MKSLERSKLRTQKNLLFAWLTMALFLFTANWSFAQLSTASVHGVVTDPQGSVVPNAAIDLRNVDTSVDHTTVSNKVGAYVFQGITPGRYTIQVKVGGFNTSEVPTFALTVGQVASIDFSLKVGSQATSVMVQSAQPLLETSSSNLGTVIGTRQVNDLPLNGRNFTQLLLLTPGASAVNRGQNAAFDGGGPTVIGSLATYPALNGQTNRSNYFLMDGLSDNITIYANYGVPPIVDAIQEFKVVSHTDSAEFGSVLGGVVNVVTKSGTNSLHGSGWEYARNAIFNARTYFLPPTAKKADFSQNQFGGSIGGPVWIPKLYNGRDKTFFFGAYQGLRYTETSNTLQRVPTAAQLAGDESDWTTQIYNPFSTRPDPNNPGQYIRDPFVGNQIPTGLINPDMLAWAQLVYPPAGPPLDSSGDNYVDTRPITQTQNEWTVRVDQKIGANDSAWFRYSTITSSTDTPGGVPDNTETAQDHPTNWGGSYVHVFNPSTTLQLQFGRSVASQFDDAVYSKRTQAISAAGFSSNFYGNMLAGPGGVVLPTIGISGYTGPYESFTNSPNVSNNTQYSGSLTKLWGNHSLHVGGGYITMGESLLNSYASIDYSAPQTGNPENSAETGDPLASFLVGYISGARSQNTNQEEQPGGVFDVFAQDSWRVNEKLTLNYGLRYDLTLIPGPGTNATIGQNGGVETGDMDFNNGTYVLAKVPPPCTVRGHAPCIPGDGSLPANVVVSPNGRLIGNTYTNLGPRVGFAYQANDKMVLRGGFGIVYDSWAAVVQMAQNVAGSWPSVGQQQLNNLNNAGDPFTDHQDPLANGGPALYPSATPFSQGGYFYDPHIKNPRSEQYNLGVQQQLNRSTTATLNYVGSMTQRLDIGGYYNTALTPGPGDPQSRALYPYIIATNWDRSIGHANYNALQFSLDKRYDNGLAYQVAYTWSKAMNVATDGWFGVEGGVGGEVPQDPYHPDAYGSYSVAGFDVTNNLVVNAIYQVPVGKGKSFSTGNGFADYILGNWQLNTIFSARSGTPFTPYINADVANTGNNPGRGYEHLDLIGNPNLGHRSANEWFNTAAYAVPQNYTFGSAGRNSLRSNGFWNLDASIFRLFPIGGSRSFELRAEAFNVFNNVVLGIPNSNLNSGISFGKVTSTANTARQLQLAVKFLF